MNVLDYTNQIANLIEGKRGYTKGSVQVFFLDGGFHVGEADLSARRDSVLLSLTTEDVENGLYNWQWQFLQFKIMNLIKEGKLK